MSNLNWTFPYRGLQDAEEAFDGTLANFSGDLGSILREAIQNSADAKWPIYDNGKKVQIDVSIIKLTDNHKKKFLNAMSWDTLSSHLKAVAETNTSGANSLDVKIKKGLKNISSGSLYLLKVEDFNTSGLYGPELKDDTDHSDIKNAYSAALFATGISEKTGGGSGGSYGMGKFALMKGSSIQTTIYNSCVSKELGKFRIDGKEIDLTEFTEGNYKNRIIGRVSLGDHKINDDKFDKQGWFGESEVREKEISILGEIHKNKEEVAVSSWAEESFVKNLYLDRNGKPGTSVLIVGYNPEKDFGTYERDVADIVHAIKRTISISFWPAMAKSNKFAGGIDIRVGGFENNKTIEEFKVIDPKDYVSQHVVLLNTFEDQISNPIDEINNTGELKEYGDKVSRVVEVEIPQTKSVREIGANHHEKTNHDIAVLTEYIDKSESIDEEIVNKVALVRSPGMVVKYEFGEDKTHPHGKVKAYGKNFISVALVGAYAQDPNYENDAKVADQFFKNSEPPHHDSWTAKTEAFQNYYSDLSATKFNKILKKIRDSISDLLKEQYKVTSNIPEEMRKDLSIPGEGTIIDGESSPGFRLTPVKTEFNEKTLSYNIKAKLVAPKKLEGKVKVEIGVSESSIQGSKRKLPFEIKKGTIKGNGGKLIENNVFIIDKDKLAQNHRSITFDMNIKTKQVGIDPFDIAIELDKPIVLEDK